MAVLDRDAFADAVLGDYRQHRHAIQGMVAEAERGRTLHAVIHARAQLYDAARLYSGQIYLAAAQLHEGVASWFSERMIAFSAPGINDADRHVRYLMQPQHGSDYYFDALGRRVRGEHYVRTLARMAAVESELAALREAGATHVRVTYEDSEHRHHGRVIALDDHEACREVLHPNTTARIEPCSDPM